MKLEELFFLLNNEKNLINLFRVYELPKKKYKMQKI